MGLTDKTRAIRATKTWNRKKKKGPHLWVPAPSLSTGLQRLSCSGVNHTCCLPRLPAARLGGTTFQIADSSLPLSPRRCHIFYSSIIWCIIWLASLISSPSPSLSVDFLPSLDPLFFWTSGHVRRRSRATQIDPDSDFRCCHATGLHKTGIAITPVDHMHSF